MISFDEQVEKMKKSLWLSFFVSFLFFVFAFILLFKEKDFIGTFILILCFFCLILGFIHILKYFRLEKNTRFFSNDILLGIVFLLFGFIALLKNDVIAGMVTYLLSAYLIYKHAERIQICFNIKQQKEKPFWYYLAGCNVIGLVLGILIILNPFGDTISFTTLIAYCIILSEIISVFQGIVLFIGFQNKPKKEKE